jgi:hypothetical protein
MTLRLARPAPDQAVAHDEHQRGPESNQQRTREAEGYVPRFIGHGLGRAPVVSPTEQDEDEDHPEHYDAKALEPGPLTEPHRWPPDGRRVSAGRRPEGDERIRCTRMFGGSDEATSGRTVIYDLPVKTYPFRVKVPLFDDSQKFQRCSCGTTPTLTNHEYQPDHDKRCPNAEKADSP